MDFEVTTTEHPTATVVAVVGELDIATAPRVTEVLDHTGAASPHGRVVIDLTRTEFIDSTGVRTLANAARDGDGGHVAIVCPAANRAVTRVMELTGFAAYLPLHETLGDLGLGAGAGADDAGRA